MKKVTGQSLKKMELAQHAVEWNYTLTQYATEKCIKNLDIVPEVRKLLKKGHKEKPHGIGLNNNSL
jgi:hypothetical protein